MSSIDEIIAHRLRKLKTENDCAPPPTGNPPPPAKRTDAEQVEDLMKQLSEETRLDSGVLLEKRDIDSEIRQRLDHLKSSTTSLGIATREESVRKIVERYSALAELEGDRVSPTDSLKAELKTGDETLPWCVICNEDGTLVCKECDGDIYCKQCFFEFHDKEEVKTHSTMPFKK